MYCTDRHVSEKCICKLCNIYSEVIVIICHYKLCQSYYFLLICGVFYF